MDQWPQREAFAKRLKEYQGTSGKTQAQVAEEIGLSLNSLRQVLYQKARRASFETCKRAASVFGCSVTEFVDDPGSAPIAGVSQEQWSEATEKQRVLAAAMFSDITALEPEEAEQLYQLWKHAQGIGRARREAEQKATGEK